MDPDELVRRVLECPGVVAMSGAVRTHLPGRTVDGVRVKDDSVEFHVIIDAACPAPQVGALIQRCVRGLVQGRSVNIVVEDTATGGTRG